MRGDYGPEAVRGDAAEVPGDLLRNQHAVRFFSLPIAFERLREVKRWGDGFRCEYVTE